MDEQGFFCFCPFKDLDNSFSVGLIPVVIASTEELLCSVTCYLQLYSCYSPLLLVVTSWVQAVESQMAAETP